ncbi:hypothetical protein CVT25_014924 [Psilocybe cyanescens]|uniref:3'-5' exonuclease n=1 Tax=Psilocybe cyanescens TaxID=93625 RepID=A0A409XI27_PSICY|nr:hypothetical protein CVT25_014924 [Psilocybe cyanescens]
MSNPPPPAPSPTLLYSWSEYNPNIRLLYIRSHQQANLELAKLGSGPQVLGFDLEWKPTYRKGATENPVALVQLSNHDTIFLLQITAMKEFPSKLAEILANPLVVKAGVAIQSQIALISGLLNAQEGFLFSDDVKKVYHDCHVPVYNCVDLSLLARTVDNARWKGKYNNPLGLARLIESYEFRLLPKGKTTRSNWEAILDDRQLEYASNDAHAGYILYKKLEGMIPLLQDPPESVWYSFNLVSGRLLNSDGFSWHAHNPNYDPGPPPPRVPREPRSADNQDAESHNKVENRDSSKSYHKRDHSHPHPSSGREVERRPRNGLLSHPYGAAYQGQAQNEERFSNGSDQYQTNRSRAHHQYHSTPQTSHMPLRTAHNQHSGVFSTGSSAQFHDDATRNSGLPSNNRGRNDGTRLGPNSGDRSFSQSNPNRFRNGYRNYRRPDYSPGEDASNS